MQKMRNNVRIKTKNNSKILTKKAFKKRKDFKKYQKLNY